MVSGPQRETRLYFELLRRGYDVSIGKAGEKEVDFIAISPEEKIYYQVSETISANAQGNESLTRCAVSMTTTKVTSRLKYLSGYNRKTVYSTYVLRYTIGKEGDCHDSKTDVY